MDTGQLIATISSICTVIALVGTIVSKLMHAHTTKLVNTMVKDYLSELKPNSGSSMRDTINDIKEDIVEVKINVATLEGKFDQHIKENI
jgi:prenyltransferase beta subunit